MKARLSVYHVRLWPRQNGDTKSTDWKGLLAGPWTSPPEPSVKRARSLNGPAERARQARSRRLTVRSERATKETESVSEWREGGTAAAVASPQEFVE